jgi:hypothetical protein
MFIPVYPNRFRNPSGLATTNVQFAIPGGVEFEDLSMTFRTMRWPRSEGGRPLIQAPTDCSGTWHFTASVRPGAFGGPELDASDDVPCLSGGEGAQ